MFCAFCVTYVAYFGLSHLENCEDDMILEVIILAGTFCAEEVCATTLLESGIIKHVIDHLNGIWMFIILSFLNFIS